MTEDELRAYSSGIFAGCRAWDDTFKRTPREEEELPDERPYRPEYLSGRKLAEWREGFEHGWKAGADFEAKLRYACHQSGVEFGAAVDEVLRRSILLEEPDEPDLEVRYETAAMLAREIQLGEWPGRAS
jgi:hypothetical protein